MEIHPIAHFRSPFGTKFGIPRQSGVVESLRGSIVFEAPYRSADAIRGLEGFDYVWLVWGFSANDGADVGLTVRPPRLGGNRRMGVFATRSPFRPNGLGLSSVRIEAIEICAGLGPLIHVRGADLMDGTPIYDLKPYLPYTDSHPDAHTGFAVDSPAPRLRVTASTDMLIAMGQSDAETLLRILEQDPRPQYHDDPTRVYGFAFGEWDVRFIVAGNVLTVKELRRRLD